MFCATFPPISKVTPKKGLAVQLEGQRGPRILHCSEDQHYPLNRPQQMDPWEGRPSDRDLVSL